MSLYTAARAAVWTTDRRDLIRHRSTGTRDKGTEGRREMERKMFVSSCTQLKGFIEDKQVKRLIALIAAASSYENMTIVLYRLHTWRAL